MHIFSLKIKKASFYAANTFTYEPERIRLIASCPQNGNDFAMSISIIPDENSTFDFIGIDKFIDCELDINKFEKTIHFTYEEAGVAEYLKNHPNVSEFTLSIPPGGLKFDELNIIAIV